MGGIWIFLAACIGLGALWNAALWVLAPLLPQGWSGGPRRGGSSDSGEQGKQQQLQQQWGLQGSPGGGGMSPLSDKSYGGAGGRGGSLTLLLQPEDGGATGLMGEPVTTDEAVRCTNAKLREVRTVCACVVVWGEGEWGGQRGWMITRIRIHTTRARTCMTTGHTTLLQVTLTSPLPHTG